MLKVLHAGNLLRARVFIMTGFRSPILKWCSLWRQLETLPGAIIEPIRDNVPNCDFLRVHCKELQKEKRTHDLNMFETSRV
jgi:hypothetical protein